MTRQLTGKLQDRQPHDRKYNILTSPQKGYPGFVANIHLTPLQTESGLTMCDRKIHALYHGRRSTNYRAVPLTDIVRNASLPKVVLLEGSDDGVPSELLHYIGKPVLLWTIVSNTLVRACSLVKDVHTDALTMGKLEFFIPEDYNGLFELIDLNRRTSDGYTTISEVARVMPRFFLTKSKLNCIEEKVADGVRHTYPEIIIESGSMLQTVRMFGTRWKGIVETGFIKRKTREVVTQNMAYLECITGEGRKVLISLKQRGRFYAIYQNNWKGKPSRCVYRMCDLIAHIRFPVVCRLVLGKEPDGSFEFSGFLRLETSEKTMRLIGSSINDKPNTLVNIIVNSHLNVKAVELKKGIWSSDTYLNSLSYVEKHLNRMMRTTHTESVSGVESSSIWNGLSTSLDQLEDCARLSNLHRSARSPQDSTSCGVDEQHSDTRIRSEHQLNNGHQESELKALCELDSATPIHSNLRDAFTLCGNYATSFASLMIPLWLSKNVNPRIEQKTRLKMLVLAEENGCNLTSESLVRLASLGHEKDNPIFLETERETTC